MSNLARRSPGIGTRRCEPAATGRHDSRAYGRGHGGRSPDAGGVPRHQRGPGPRSGHGSVRLVTRSAAASAAAPEVSYLSRAASGTRVHDNLTPALQLSGSTTSTPAASSPQVTALAARRPPEPAPDTAGRPASTEPVHQPRRPRPGHQDLPDQETGPWHGPCRRPVQVPRTPAARPAAPSPSQQRVCCDAGPAAASPAGQPDDPPPACGVTCQFRSGGAR
jgi:hypothetical protein